MGRKVGPAPAKPRGGDSAAHSSGKKGAFKGAWKERGSPRPPQHSPRGGKDEEGRFLCGAGTSTSLPWRGDWPKGFSETKFTKAAALVPPISSWPSA